MADVGHQRFTKSVFYTPPLTAKSSENFHYQLFWWWLVLFNSEMLVMTKNQFCPILLIIKMLDQKWIFWVFSRTLVIDILSRQSMLQINCCGHKSNAYS